MHHAVGAAEYPRDALHQKQVNCHAAIKPLLVETLRDERESLRGRSNICLVPLLISGVRSAKQSSTFT